MPSEFESREAWAREMIRRAKEGWPDDVELTFPELESGQEKEGTD